jgi:transposase
MAEVIDAQLLASGRRAPGNDLAAARPLEPPLKNGGLTVGESLTLASLGRACHATSKRGFAEWASSTSLGSLAEVDVDRLTSQHFWDQMDQVPLEAIDPIERELVGRVLERFDVPLDAVLFDATNFFTFIASTNKRPTLPARGHNKQKRDDLRQVGVALLCSRVGGIPLWHQTYGGQVADAKSFAEAVPAVRRRLVELHRDITSMTIVFDKGNVSRKNQKLVDGSGIHYVTGLTAASQKELVQKANPLLAPVELASSEQVLAFRERRMIWGAERTAVVMLSECLREGQARGVLQHVASAQNWLGELAQTLRRRKQKRDRGRILRDIEKRLHGRQRLSNVLTYELKGDAPNLELSFSFDESAFEALKRDALGRIVLVTDRDDWSTAEIIDAYHGQSQIEAVFAHLKDPMHTALRPQFHWTDQKLHVHVHMCILGYLLAQCVFLKAQKAGAPYKSSEALLDALNNVRRATVARSVNPKGGVRLSTQLEEIDPKLGPYLPALGVGA